MLYVVLAGLLFLIFRGGSLSSLLAGNHLSSSMGQTGAPAPQAQFVQGTGDISAAQQNQFAFVQASNVALNAIPIVGPAIAAAANAITGSLIAASKKRAREATDENTAVAKAVPGWDVAMTTIRDAYNTGSISGGQAVQLVDVAWANYWNEVTPRIQPGRNGCQGGSMSKQEADQRFPGMKQCSGDWGAACCVGYADLANGANSVKAAIAQTERSGSPSTASIPAVFVSKYGGTNRAAYTLTLTRPSSLFQL